MKFNVKYSMLNIPNYAIHNVLILYNHLNKNICAIKYFVFSRIFYNYKWDILFMKKHFLNKFLV